MVFIQGLKQAQPPAFLLHRLVAAFVFELEVYRLIALVLLSRSTRAKTDQGELRKTGGAAC